MNMNVSLRPVFLLAGGRPRERKGQMSLIQAVFKECRKSVPVVGYIGTASGDDTRFQKFMEREIKSAGKVEIYHAVIAPPHADLEKAREILRRSDIIFMGGGDVEEGIAILQRKGMMKFVQDLYREGKVFYGVSAGSIMLAKEWVRWKNPDDDSSAELFPCLNIAPVICDTHDEEGGFTELQVAVSLEPPGTTGYGIPSGAAIKVNPDGSVEALGGAVWRFTGISGKVVRMEDLLPSG